MAKSMHMYQIATKIKAVQSLKVPHRQTALIAAENERRARRVRRPRDRANILMRHGQPSATYDTMASTPGVGWHVQLKTRIDCGHNAYISDGLNPCQCHVRLTSPAPQFLNCQHENLLKCKYIRNVWTLRWASEHARTVNSSHSHFGARYLYSLPRSSMSNK